MYGIGHASDMFQQGTQQVHAASIAMMPMPSSSTHRPSFPSKEFGQTRNLTRWLRRRWVRDPLTKMDQPRIMQRIAWHMVPSTAVSCVSLLLHVVVIHQKPAWYFHFHLDIMSSSFNWSKQLELWYLGSPLVDYRICIFYPMQFHSFPLSDEIKSCRGPDGNMTR